METSGANPSSKEVQLKASKDTAMATAVGTTQAIDSYASSLERHQRPPYSYVALITMAIENSPKKRAMLSEICQFISDKFPYYRERWKKMRNSIKHNLSLNKCCVRLPLQEDQSRKSCYWVIDPEYQNMFHGGSFRRRKKTHLEDDAVLSSKGTRPKRRTLASTIVARESPGTISTSTPQPSVVSTVPAGDEDLAGSTPMEEASTMTIARQPTCNKSNKHGADSNVLEATTTIARQPTGNKDGAGSSAVVEATTITAHQPSSTVLSVPPRNADSEMVTTIAHQPISTDLTAPPCNADSEMVTTIAHQPISTDLSIPLCNADSEMVTTIAHQPISTDLSVPLCNADSEMVTTIAHQPISTDLSVPLCNADSEMVTTIAHQPTSTALSFPPDSIVVEATTIANQPTSTVLSIPPCSADSSLVESSSTTTTIANQPTLPSSPFLPSSDVAYSSLETLLKTGTFTTVFAAGSGDQPVHALTAAVPDKDASNLSTQPRVLLIPFSSAVYTAAPVLASAVSLVPLPVPPSEFREIQELQTRPLGDNMASVTCSSSTADTPTTPARVHTTGGNGTTITDTFRDIALSPVSGTPSGVSGTHTSFISNGDDIHASSSMFPASNTACTAAAATSMSTERICGQVGSVASGVDAFAIHHHTPAPRNQPPSTSTSSQATSGRRSKKSAGSASLSDKRPPYSYVALIAMAIESMPLKRATLGDICNFIHDNFPYYHKRDTWKSYIRHTLSVNRCFVRLAQGFREPGSNSYWIIDPAYRNMFSGGTYRRRNFAFHDLPMYSGATAERSKRRENMRLMTSQRWEGTFSPSAFTAGQRTSFPQPSHCNGSVQSGIETTPL